MIRLHRIRDDQSGMSYVFIGMGMMAFLSASMLAIDVGMLMTSRSQAQNAADAGALAGATALVFNDFDNRTPGGPAVTQAIAAAKSNDVMGADVAVDPSDVTFPLDQAGTANRVKVDVFRTTARGNPVSTLIAQFFGASMKTANIAATATAEASPANAMTCVKPFTIPDKWQEKQTPPWDGNDTYDAFNNKGVPLANPDIYIPGDPVRLHRLQPGIESRSEAGHPRRNRREHHRQLLLFARDLTAGSAPAARSTAGTSPTATPGSCTGAIRCSRNPARWADRPSRVPMT